RATRSRYARAAGCAAPRACRPRRTGTAPPSPRAARRARSSCPRRPRWRRADAASPATAPRAAARGPSSCAELEEAGERDADPAGALRDLVAQLVERLLDQEELEERLELGRVGRHRGEAGRAARIALAEMVRRAAFPRVHRGEPRLGGRARLAPHARGVRRVA